MKADLCSVLEDSYCIGIEIQQYIIMKADLCLVKIYLDIISLFLTFFHLHLCYGA
jgi:hypothetical protein